MTRAYARSKLALLMTTTETARATTGTGVTLNVVHPGLVATGLVRSGGIDQAAWRLLSRVALSEAQGADTPLHAALSPELDGISGRYLKRRALVAPNRLAPNGPCMECPPVRVANRHGTRSRARASSRGSSDAKSLRDTR